MNPTERRIATFALAAIALTVFYLGYQRHNGKVEKQIQTERFKSEYRHYNTGVTNGATAAVNGLMDRMLKNRSLTITLNDKDIEAIRVEAIGVASVK